MKNFNDLLEVSAKLLGPEGCPWDRKQTLSSLKKYVIEEANEVGEAVELKDWKNLKEELGDLLYNIIFMAKLADSNKLFNIHDVIDDIYIKIVRRHPHVFGNAKLETAEDVQNAWKKIKEEEKRLRG